MTEREAAVRLSVDGHQQRRLRPLDCRRDAENHLPSDSVSCTSVRTSDFGCMSRDVEGAVRAPRSGAETQQVITDCLHQS